MFSGISITNQNQQNVDTQRHCILLAASNPYNLSTPVYKPVLRSSELNENMTTQLEVSLADAETIAKSFAEVARESNFQFFSNFFKCLTDNFFFLAHSALFHFLSFPQNSFQSSDLSIMRYVESIIFHL